ncbi:hypothetical protein [Roseburia sp. MSJ-14]|uniref:hypothetical protein n=1 Tax=Roseburia sp. MSJ-14 TaxID=2841514 RepID=UPI001C10049B|nr:hypothetical protein [Roseburia sp. MSJ-14]MBU5473970.1 hypothetical protein [Roseburia sp. MSJ-14]
MINKDKIVFNTKTYYTCAWNGVIGVKILKVYDGKRVLVQAGKDPFIRPIQYVYNEYEHARRGRRDWEHFERQRKKKKKSAKKKGKTDTK